MARYSMYSDANIKCPFFMNQTDRGVSCEGIEGTHSVSVNFMRRSQKEEYISLLCGSHNYEQCQIFKEVYRKYEDSKVSQHKGQSR